MKLKLSLFALIFIVFYSNRFNASEVQGSTINTVSRNEEGSGVAGVKLNLYDDHGILVDSGVTDNQGELVFEHLLPGKYTIKEIYVPYPYVLYHKIYDLYISEDGQTINIDNTVTKSDSEYISVYQVDNVSEDAYGYEYTIYDQKGTIVDVLKTNKSGHASSRQLPEGVYYITQTSVPEGSSIDNRLFKLEVTGQEKYVAYSEISTRVDGSFDFQVVDQHGDGLVDVKYTVYSGDEKISSASSDENGVVSFTDIPYGTYQLQQTYNSLATYSFAVTKEQGEIGVPLQVVINNQELKPGDYVLAQLVDTCRINIIYFVLIVIELIFIKVGLKYGSNKSFSS